MHFSIFLKKIKFQLTLYIYTHTILNIYIYIYIPTKFEKLSLNDIPTKKTYSISVRIALWG